MKFFASTVLLAGLAASAARATPAEDIAAALVENGSKAITVESLPADFARLTKFVRHDGNGMVLFTDGGSTDGYVRHAQAHFDILPAARRPNDKVPLFAVAFEFVDQSDFTFEGLAAAMEHRLGTPSVSSNRPGATFRTWLLKQPEGRNFTIAQGQASDNGDPITLVQLIQNR